MILRTEIVDQIIDINIDKASPDRTVTLVKDVVMTDGVPLGMVRKRLPPPAQTRAAVLLIHGFGQNRYTWHIEGRSFSAYLAAAGFDVFNVDLRGTGRSGEFSGVRPRIVEEYVREDVPACAREAMRLSGHDKVFLVGHSMGGLISYATAASVLRGTVAGVTTLGSPYHFGAGSGFLGVFASAARAVRFTGVFDANPRLPMRILGRQFQRLRPMWDMRAIPLPVRVWHPGAIEPELLDRYVEKAFDMTSVEVLFDVLKGGTRVALRSRDGRVDYGRAFEGLEMPLLVIAGEHDLLAPPESVKQAYSLSRSDDKRYRVFPFGHADLIVGREATTTVWPLVRDWLQSRA